MINKEKLFLFLFLFLFSLGSSAHITSRLIKSVTSVIKTTDDAALKAYRDNMPIKSLSKRDKSKTKPGLSQS